MKTSLLSQEGIIKREKILYKKSFKEINESNMEVDKRKVKTFIEWDFNMPQTIFFIYLGDLIICGRKVMSELYREGKLKSINCSKITYNMILGYLKNYSYNSRKIILKYIPLNNEEKIEIFKRIVKSRTAYIDYPFRFKFFDSNLEQTSNDLSWKVDDKIANYLSIGEKHHRDYTRRIIKRYVDNPKIIYDPACSTGEFLYNLKKIYPNSITIGHDLDPSMVDYSKKYVDESLCCDAFDSPIKNDSVDLLVLRFLNGGVLSTEDAKKLFKKLINKVKKDGYILCIGHTPILLSHDDFISLNLNVKKSIGYDKNTNSIFQYYLVQKR